ncbi:MAG: hypothetical protein EBR52_09295 [Microbacteriaceae bacterium]|nr:hypothetical protein [Microbacteriaceae bacterium]
MGEPRGFMKYKRQVSGYAPVTDRLKHYNEFLTILAPEEVKTQGARCMDCGVPFCHTGCPLGNIIPDFNDPVNEYGNIHIEVADPDKSDFTVTDLRNRSEVIYSRDPTVSLVFADHAGLMAPRHHHSSTTERLNEVLRDLKRFSMSFNRGAGIATVALFQIWYNLTHLSYANEAERSSDIVTAGWVDDNLRQQSLLKLQCLKSRDDQPFEDFYAGVLWPCRRIFSTNAVSVEQSRKVGEDVDKMLAG